MAAFSPPYGYYDVTAPPYNAKGDGTTDDAAAIQAAEKACEKTGGVVYFPPGTYLVKSTTTIGASNVCWQGAGAGASTIKADSSLGKNNQILIVGPGVSSIFLGDLTFQGNGLNNGLNNPPGKDAITVGTSGMPIVQNCIIRDCIFYLTTPGATVHFNATTNAEVEGCRFYQVGFDNGRLGDAQDTPAVRAEDDCTNIRVYSNHFEQCNYDGVRIAGIACEVSSNYLLETGGTAIDVGIHVNDGNGCRVFGNFVDTTNLITTSNQGIYIQVIQNFQVIGNTMKKAAGDGIAGGACTGGAYVGNVCFDNSVLKGDTGLQFIGQNYYATANQGVAFIGNVCYDDQSPNQTQQYGIRTFTKTDLLAVAQNFTFLGNTFWGNAKADFETDNQVLNDNSDQAIANGSWVDRQHETSATLTGTMAKTSLVSSNPMIQANSMNPSTGLRIVASGSTTSGAHPGTRTFYLGLGSSGNLMNGVNAGSSDGVWQLEAYVMNNNSFTSQNAFVHFWYNGTLLFSSRASTTVTTSSQTSVLLEGALGNASDSIVTNFLSVERV